MLIHGYAAIDNELVWEAATARTQELRRVLDNLLGAPPPPPLPNVPALAEPKAGEAPKTMRQQMEQHRVDPVCAGCHKTMDPIGFAMENFDVDGTWRTENVGGIALV